MVAVSNPAAGQKTLWFNPAGNKEDTDFERVSLCKQRGALATNVHIHMVAQNHGHVRMPWSNSTARSSGVPRPHYDQRRRSTPEARRRATGGLFLIIRKHKHILTMTDHERSGCDRTRERERKLGVGWGFLYAYMVLTLNSCIRADTCSRRPCSGSTPLPLPRSRSRRRSSKCSRSLRLPRLQRPRGRPWWPRCPRRRRP